MSHVIHKLGSDRIGAFVGCKVGRDRANVVGHKIGLNRTSVSVELGLTK